MLSVPYGSIVWASEALAVLVVVDAVPVDVAELEVAAAVAGREESFASVCNHDTMVSAFRSYQSQCVERFYVVSTLTAYSKILVLGSKGE